MQSNTRQRLENDATLGNSLKQMQGQDLSEKSARYKKNNASMIKPFQRTLRNTPVRRGQDISLSKRILYGKM